MAFALALPVSHLRTASLLVASVCFVLPACGVGTIDGGGGGGGGGGGAGPDAGQAANVPDAEPNAPDAIPPDYSLSVPPTGIELSLGQSAELEVSVTSARFAGPVTLAAGGVPASWNVTFDPSNIVDLTSDATSQVTVRIEIPTDAEAAQASLTINADAAPGLRSGSAPVNVANELIVTIGDGTGGGAHGFTVGARVRVGTTIKILNADGTNHRIHSNNGDAGFPHESGELSQGQDYSFTFTAAGTFDYYCHIHDAGAGVGSFIVTAP